ncbi:MAG TPA: hypothetical protein VF578_03900 [Methylomirabilota bacterium]
MRLLLPTRPSLRPGPSLVGLALLAVGCASQPSLVPQKQADAIEIRERALASHSSAIQDAIRQSNTLGALAFIDNANGRLVVLPGDTPGDAWARHRAAPSGAPPSVPPVVDFVYRPDIAKAPETVTARLLDEQQRLRDTLAATDAELRRLSDSIATVRQETQASIAASREDVKTSLDALTEDLAAARKFMLQTAQLGWLDHELTNENANTLRKLTATSQELTATSTKLTETIQHLSDTLSRQLKDLAARLDALQNRVSNVK